MFRIFVFFLSSARFIADRFLWGRVIIIGNIAQIYKYYKIFLRWITPPRSRKNFSRSISTYYGCLFLHYASFITLNHSSLSSAQLSVVSENHILKFALLWAKSSSQSMRVLLLLISSRLKYLIPIREISLQSIYLIIPNWRKLIQLSANQRTMRKGMRYQISWLIYGQKIPF